MPTASFFNFFSPPQAPTDDDDDDAASDIEGLLEFDYQLGEDIKEKIIPRAIDWFTGEALAFEPLDDDEDDLEGAFDDDEDDDDDDSEDRDDDEESDEGVSHCTLVPSSSRVGHHMRMETNADTFRQDDTRKPKQEPTECKQS